MISYLLRNIPADLWQSAKHAAIDRNQSLRALILQAIRESLERDTK